MRLVDDRRAVLAGVVQFPGGQGGSVLTDQQAGHRADSAGDIEAGCDAAFDDPLSGLGGGSGDCDLHALNQRCPGGPWPRVSELARCLGHGCREGLRPVAPGAVDDRQR